MIRKCIHEVHINHGVGEGGGAYRIRPGKFVARHWPSTKSKVVCRKDLNCLLLVSGGLGFDSELLCYSQKQTHKQEYGWTHVHGHRCWLGLASPSLAFKLAPAGPKGRWSNVLLSAASGQHVSDNPSSLLLGAPGHPPDVRGLLLGARRAAAHIALGMKR